MRGWRLLSARPSESSSSLHGSGLLFIPSLFNKDHKYPLMTARRWRLEQAQHRHRRCSQQPPEAWGKACLHREWDKEPQTEPGRAGKAPLWSGSLLSQHPCQHSEACAACSGSKLIFGAQPSGIGQESPKNAHTQSDGALPPPCASEGCFSALRQLQPLPAVGCCCSGLAPGWSLVEVGEILFGGEHSRHRSWMFWSFNPRIS